MTIKDISKDDKTIQFNPLVKLNQTIVDKIPENSSLITLNYCFLLNM